MSHSKAILAGGCFWGMQELFRSIDGVVDTEVGYTGGSNANPTYREHPGHAEAIEITYDDSIVSYEQVLDFFFRIHNPTTKDRQGNDVGSSYRSAIFYKDESEKEVAQNFISLVNDSGVWSSPVATTLEVLSVFYPAESEHQDYLQRFPNGYTCHFVQQESYLSNS